MTASKYKPDVATPLALGAALTGIAYVLIPLVFGQRMEVSPFLLFAIVVVCNIAPLFVPTPAVTTARTTLTLFCARLAVSALFSALLFVIDRTARALG